MTIHRKHSAGHGWLAFILCIALCLGNIPLHVWAAEEGAAGAGTIAEEGQDEDAVSADSSDSSDRTESPDSNGSADDSDGDGSSDSADHGDDADDSEGSGGTAVPDSDGTPDIADDSAASDASVSDNDTDSISKNDIPSVSDNTTDETRQALIREAEEAFGSLLGEKDLMALLFHTDSYAVRSGADEDSAAAATLAVGQTLYIKGVRITADDVWYLVQYWLDGAEGTGYVQSYYLAYSDEDWIAWEEQYLFPILAAEDGTYGNTAYGMAAYSMRPYSADTSDIAAFPASYQSALGSLKSMHPNWTFVPMKTGLDFGASVSREMGDKSLIQKTSNNASKGWVGESCPSESGWYYATRPAVEYHMDPRNFLTETYIFQFEQLTYNASYHTETAVQTFLNGTFMKGKLADDTAGRTYAQAFYEIGKGRKLSPIHLASRVYQEQGQGNSGLISGTYPGYEGYYNFFNVGVNGASTAEKIVKGLTYAKEKGWNTRYKSLEGGAATIGNGYILKYQDTIYLEKFNVDRNSPYGVYNHQYMQNIQAPASESSSTRKMYANAGSLDSAFVFKIPVYDNMPVETPLTGISLNRTELRLRRPDTVVEDTSGLSEAERAENIAAASLQVSYDPADTTADKTITWTSSNGKIATVKADPADSSRAVVNAVGKGEVTITARASKADGQTASCKVHVSAPIYRVTLTNRSAGEEELADQTTLLAGQSVNLSAEYQPADTTSDTHVVWRSSNPKAATVENGKVTAVGEDPANNIAVITASMAGCEKGYSAQHTVVVENCTVTFMERDGRTVLGEPQRVLYGGTLSAETLRAREQMLQDAGSTDRIFIGWYTGEDGTGRRFDETTAVYGRHTTLYPCYEEQGRGFYVLPIGDQTYTGSAVKPVVQVYDSVIYGDGSRELIELALNKDYTVSYKNNKNVNQEGQAVPTITVKGKGNYAGTEQATFNIIPKALTDTDITADNLTAAYSGKVIKSAPTVYRDGKKLVKNKDYTVTYPLTETGAYQTAGVYPIVIKGKGGYSGTITIREIITREVLMSKVSIAKIPNQTYRSDLVDKEQGVGIAPDALQVTYKKQPLVESRDGGLTGDYTVAYSNNTAVGTAKATITAVKGSGFTGSKSISYKIVGMSIARAKVEGVTGRAYTGSEEDARQPKYTLTLGGRELVESRDGGLTGDYLVTYKNTDKAGTATVIFQGINEYTGQIKKTYKITAYDISLDDSGSNAAITMQYCTQDAPEELKPVAAVAGDTAVSGSVMFSSITTPYVKGGSKPTVLLYFHGSVLTAGKDYTVKYANNNALTPTDPEEWNERKLPKLTITGRGNFKGSIVVYYTITDGRMAQDNGKLTMTAKDVVFQDKKGAYKSTITITDCNGAKLTAGKDYDRKLTYTYCAADTNQNSDGSVISAKSGVSMGEADISVGEADIPIGEVNRPVGEDDIPEVGTLIRVTARGIGMYAGDGDGTAELSATYRIVAADISRAKVTAQAQVYRNGQEITLTPEDLKVTMSGSPDPLVYGVDYTIDESTYANHWNKGKASVSIRGCGNYGGVKKISYTIGSKALVWWKNLAR